MSELFRLPSRYHDMSKSSKIHPEYGRQFDGQESDSLDDSRRIVGPRGGVNGINRTIYFRIRNIFLSRSNEHLQCGDLGPATNDFWNLDIWSIVGVRLCKVSWRIHLVEAASGFLTIGFFSVFSYSYDPLYIIPIV